MAWPKFGQNTNPEAGNEGTNVENKDTNAENAEHKNEPSIADQIAAALQPIADGIKATNDRMVAMESRLPKERPANEEANQLPTVFDDENAAFNARLTPVLVRQLEMEARMVKADVKAEYTELGFGDMWKQYSAEIDQVLNDTPVVNGQGKLLRGDPQYVRNTVDMIFGRAARTKGVKFNAKDNTFFLESASHDSENNGNAPNLEGMTADQRRVFERMGVPLDQAKSTLGKLKFVN